ncbi:HD family phosphohydrolase [Flexilinea flocculi]|uniref:Protein containing HDIG domain n=1 Tax=Flexilinea flocculi TaxID=1678840 RepID=A0A0S7BM54_9CHLR|nr:HDIG domain-containing metalloprotein [Flexilinea flocculi]GAP41357.1 protein containing HDIG domain [Flexilinea flocculi]
MTESDSSTSISNNLKEKRRWRNLIYIVSVLLTFALLTIQISVRKSSYSLKIGDVTTQDILAPRTVTYISEILTEQARKDAEDIVGKVYLPADPTISRNQSQNLRSTFQFISTVREDEYASELQKIEDINKLVYVRLDESTIRQILDLSETDWNTVQTESQRVLEQVMQNSIRDTQVISRIENIPTMINYYINPQIADLINGITRKFVVPNSLYSEELTEKNKQEARDSVQARERTYVTNQTIVSRGQIITPLIFEALDEMGLVYSDNNRQRITAAACLVFGLALFALVFFLNDSSKVLRLRETLLLALLYLLFLFSARLIIPNRVILPYIFPIQALGLTIACLSGNRLGIIFSIIISILAPYDFTDAICYTTFYIVSSITGILVLRKGRQISSFFLAGLSSGFIGIPIILAYQFTNKATDAIGLLTLSAASILSGLFSVGITLFSQYLFSRFIGLATSLQLMEIIRPDSPLLQYILSTAPGTYQHSLMVANLSEQAAKEIGADPLLVRAGAMYHDAGKALNPSFFVENQVSGNLNLHDDISPKESAASIIQHVPDGVNLIKKYRLPERIIDFVEQHHGTNVTRYQLNQAMNSTDSDQTNISDFTYPGPSPQSKETALVMLADTCEARARADKPKNDEEIKDLVKSVFDYYSTSGQLDYAPLTLQDLTKIRESFIKVLRNTYHPRVRYPDQHTKSKNGSQKLSIKQKTNPAPEDDFFDSVVQ